MFILRKHDFSRKLTGGTGLQGVSSKLNLGNKITLSEWIGEQPCMQMDFRQFFRNDMFVSISEKLSEIHLHAQLFSNPCGKVLFNSKMLFIIPNFI